MSRSGLTEDCDDDDPLAYGRWQGAVRSAMRGKRGQAALKELLAALDALPDRRLIAQELEAGVSGMPFRRRQDVCALGALGRARGIDMSDLNPDDMFAVADRFDLSHAMAAEIVWTNDEYPIRNETPEQRWERMRAWVAKQIKP